MTDAGDAGTGEALAERMKLLSTEQLHYETRRGDNEYRIPAYLELIERIVATGPKAKAASRLMRYAHGPELPHKVRIAAGLKAVELTDSVDTLVEWAQNVYLPDAVRDAAGLKAIAKAMAEAEIGAIRRMDGKGLSETLVDARCRKFGGGLVDLSRGGMLSEGTIRPPARYAGREQTRARMAV